MAKLQVFLSDDNEVTHDLGEETLTIGRLPDNGIEIDDDSVSSHHAELVPEGNSYRLRDLGSTNGTAVNAVPITDAVLNSGDAVRIGRVEAKFVGTENQGEAFQPPPILLPPPQPALLKVRGRQDSLVPLPSHGEKKAGTRLESPFTHSRLWASWSWGPRPISSSPDWSEVQGRLPFTFTLPPPQAAIRLPVRRSNKQCRENASSCHGDGN